MKIPALLTCLLVALLALVPLSRAHADEVSFDVFYNSLADDGDWYNTPEYGYVWQPYIAYKTEKWRPYSDGYWAQTDDGWTWVSYENFGWAAYHYGRWTRLKDTGWVWVPGYEWGPGWVSWRTNDDYVGWAPLPPKVEHGVYEGRVVERRARVEQIDYSDLEPEDTGYGTDVDVQYDIGPANYCFVETRHFGAPVLGEVLLPPQQNFVFIERTRNVTNIYYRRERERTIVYNNGPDFGYINRRVDRPIPRLQIERHDDPGFLRNGLRGGGNPTLVRDGILNVATPVISRRPQNFTQIKPTRIKQNIEQPQVVRGWANAGNTDQAATQRIRDQYKQQAASAPPRPANPVIPPAAPPRDRTEDRAAGNTPPAPAGAQPGLNDRRPGQPGTPLTEAERVARRDARQKEREQRGNGQPAAPGTASQPAADPEKEARRAARQAARPNGQPAAPTAAPENPPGNADPDKEARRAARQAARGNGQPTPEQAAPQTPGNNGRSDEERAARRAAREAGQPQQAPPQPQGNPQAGQEQEARRAARQQERANQQQAASQQAAQAQQEQEARRAARQQERANQQQAAGQAQAGQERAARQQERANQQQAASQAQAGQEQEARRAARQQERTNQQQAAGQAQAAQAQQEQEARRAARQQERAAQPQAQPQPQGNGGRERNREGGQNKPDRSPAP